MDGPWQTETLIETSAKAFLKAAEDRQASAESDAHTARTLGLIAGAGGIAFGVLCLSISLVTVSKLPPAAPPEYVGVVDAASGVVSRPVALKDAPLLFDEVTRRRYMSDFIINCEGYVPQTWAKTGYHACMIMATPDEQKRREKDIGVYGVRYPVKVFGSNGWAEPTNWLAWVPHAETGSGPNKTYHYQVRYERTEVVNGVESKPRWTADIYFQFHPELKMSDQDAIINGAGFQAVSFSTTKDSF